MSNIKNLLTIIGLPRSGTSTLFKSLAKDINIYGITEPYQIERNSNYSVVEIDQLILDSKLVYNNEDTLLVKETTTRRNNVKYVNELILNSINKGVACVSIVILRSPFEAFLSQAHASKNIWQENKLANINEDEFIHFFKIHSQNLLEHLKLINKVTTRITTYNRLTNDPNNEVKRLVASLGLPYTEVDKKTSIGGDPRANKSKGIIKNLTTWPVDELKHQIKDVKTLKIAEEFERLANMDDFEYSDRELFLKMIELTLKVN